MLGILLLGLLIGLQHAMEADHVAAVASLATRSRTARETARQGIVWGLGHALTLLCFGGLVLILDWVVPENMARALELAVGLMLILLGLDVIRHLLTDRFHFHRHTHGNLTHIHVHSHPDDVEHSQDLHRHSHPRRFSLKALLVGMMHGMAGSAALILLTLETVLSPLEGLVYILLFGLGSVVGMGMLALVIAIPMRYSERSMQWAHNGLKGTVGLVTLGLGLAIVHSNWLI